MGNIVQDFLQTLYDMPIEILKKSPTAKVASYKKTKEGEFDDWDMGVAGNYEAYVIDDKNKLFAIIYYILTVQDKYDEEDEQIQNDFNSPTDAIDVNIEKIEYKEQDQQTDEENTIDKIYDWIKNDVSKEQIKSVLWAIMISETDDEVTIMIKSKRMDYRKEREALEDEDL